MQQDRYGSVKYWKAMYETSQSLIEESYERSLKLGGIPGLLSINKVKPKDGVQKKTTRVTNFHESMEAQDVLYKVTTLEEEKHRKIKEAKERSKKFRKKNSFTNANYSLLVSFTCPARFLKDCSQCHSI